MEVEEQNSRSQDVINGLMLLIAGVLMTSLSVLTWMKGSPFALWFLPGFLVGPYFVLAGLLFFRDALRARTVD